MQAPELLDYIGENIRQGLTEGNFRKTLNPMLPKIVESLTELLSRASLLPRARIPNAEVLRDMGACVGRVVRPENAESLSPEQLCELREKLAQLELKELQTKQLKIPSPKVTVTILDVGQPILSVLRVVLQLLSMNFDSVALKGSEVQEIQSVTLERQYFSADSHIEEISMRDLYDKLKRSCDLNAHTCYVVCGEQSSIRSFLKSLSNASSNNAIHSALQSAASRLPVMDDSTQRLLTLCVKPAQEHRKPKKSLLRLRLPNIKSLLRLRLPNIGKLCLSPRKPASKSTSFPGQLFDGSYFAVDSLNLGDLFKLLAVRCPGLRAPEHEDVAPEVGKTPLDVPPHADQLETSVDPSSVYTCVSLRLNRFRQGDTAMKVGAVHYSFPYECMEFFFSCPSDMAACVGVGLSQSYVILKKDLSVEIHEFQDEEWQPQADWWKPIFTSDEDTQPILQIAAPRTHPAEVGVCQPESGKELSRKLGVGYDGKFQCRNEIHEAESLELGCPLLYTLAWSILLHKQEFAKPCPDKPRAELRCHEEAGANTSNDNDMLKNLESKRSAKKGKHSGDEGENGHGVAVREADDRPVELTVKVFPLSKCEVDVDAEGPVVEPPADCGKWAVAPQIEVVFHREHATRRVSIHATTMLSLRTIDDTSYSGRWYHDDILISLSCVEHEVGHDRVAYLEPASNKCHHRVKTSTEKATTSSEIVNDEATLESERKEFSVQDRSNPENEASAAFYLYSPPVEDFDHSSQALEPEWWLFETTDLQIEGAWIPLNDQDASPYELNITRALRRFHHNADHGESVNEVQQTYMRSFLINHAGSHF